MVRSELELYWSPMAQGLIGSFLKVPLMREVLVVEGIDRVRVRVQSVTSGQGSVYVVDYQEAVVVVGQWRYCRFCDVLPRVKLDYANLFQ
jgi:hypothetical protein